MAVNNLQQYRVNNRVLSNIAIGFAQAQSLVTFVAPTINVNTRAFKILRMGKASFAVGSTKRSPYQDHKEIYVDGYATDNIFLEQHTKKAVVAIEEVEEAENGDAQFDLQEYALQRAMYEIEQSYEKELYNLITNPANFEASNVVVVAPANRLSAAGSDPEALIRTNKTLVRLQTGQYPTRAIISEDVYVALTLHPEFREKIKHTSKDTTDLDLAASWLGLPGGIQVATRLELDDDDNLIDMFPANTWLMWYDPRDGSSYQYKKDADNGVGMFTPTPGINKATPMFAANFILREGLTVSDFKFNDKNDTLESIVRFYGSTNLMSIGNNKLSIAGVLLTSVVS